MSRACQLSCKACGSTASGLWYGFLVRCWTSLLRLVGVALAGDCSSPKHVFGRADQAQKIGMSRDASFRDILYQGSCVATRPEGYEADGSISTTSLRCLSLGEFVSDAQTLYPSCSQMLCSDTLTQSGVGVNSSCGSASIGDTCMVFCTEVYQAVLNETSTLTCACDRCDNPLCHSFGIDFSECLSLTYNETCVVRYSVRDTGAGDRNVTEFLRGSNGHLHGSLDMRRS